ncbi:MAG: hypothetical protein ACRDJE_13050 [Dehalococcoidia bacterium]
MVPRSGKALTLGTALVAVVAVALALGPDRAARAQEAGSGPPATQVKLFAPWLPNMTLNPNITVTRREMFMGNPNLPSDCQSGSISTERPDAWRCGTADPCFSPTPFSAMEVACATAPWSNEVVLLTLSRPLPGPSECQAMPSSCPRQLNLESPPWALELANGARCTAFTGTISSVAGLGLVYGCDNGGFVGVANRDAPFDKSLPLWRAFYLPKDGTAVEQVDVLTAWY